MLPSTTLHGKTALSHIHWKQSNIDKIQYFPHFVSMLLIQILFSLVCLIITCGHGYASLEQKDTTMSVSALFVFGDSTVDPGNNQFVTRTISKSNLLPYGIDFPERIPTGRYCNGRLATDFIASYLGIKEFVPPYLDPSLSLDDLVTGVSFASAGSGYDRQTSSITRAAIPVPDQLQYFSQFKRRLEESIGRERAQEIIEKAVFLVSAGTNDLAFAFVLPTFRPRTYTVSTYQRRVVYLCKQFIQGLMEQGARKIAVLNAPPIGCIPIVITTNSPLICNLRVSEQRPCNDTLSSIARGYNWMLHAEIKALQASFRMNHTNVAYVDIYNPFESYIKSPHNFGFEVVDRECCGSYLPFEEFLGCNPLAIVCNDRSKYVFWDEVHPTETTYRFIANAIRPVIEFLIHL